MKKIILCLSILGLVTGCATKVVMPSLQYEKVIPFQVAKNAYLNWEFGNQYSRMMPTNYGNHNEGLIGALASAAVDSVVRNNNPSRYTLSFGKAEQSVFMTSLRDVLEHNQVFKNIELIADSRQVSSKDVMINVFFKTARVASPERNYKITLSVEMVIETGGKAPFKRSYLVQSDAEGYNTGFRQQQMDVSRRLLDKVICGIEEWHKLNSTRSKK